MYYVSWMLQQGKRSIDKTNSNEFKAKEDQNKRKACALHVICG